jgi:hypothetical protein
MNLQKSIEEQVNIQIDANQVKPKSNSLVDIPEWERIRKPVNREANDTIVSRFEIVD